MFPVSARWVAELTRPDQRRIFRLDILDNGVIVVPNLAVTGGSVQVDGDADVRRRFDATVVDPTGKFIPNDANDPLSPYGYEARIWSGFRYSDGTEEVVPVGTMRLSSAKVADSGAQTIALSGFDRARAISRARFEVPYVVPAGQNYVQAIKDLINSRLSNVTFEAITTSAVTPLLLFDQASDPWKAVLKMVESIGCQVFFDPMGVCVIRTQPNEAITPPSFTYIEGKNATVLGVENALDDEPGFNGAVVDGEPSNLPPVHSVRYDTDATSPTYSAGRYGKVPTFLKSPYITTQQQGDDAAVATVQRHRGGTENLRFSALPNPAHDAGDAVRVVRGAVGVDSTYIVDTFGIPLSVSAPMQVTTRKRRSA